MAAMRSGDFGGLWQRRCASAISNVVVLDAVLAAVPAEGSAGAASAANGDPSSPTSLVVAAALSPLQLQLSGQQAAALAAAVGGAAAEAGGGFSMPLLLAPAEEQQEAAALPWLGSINLSCSSGVQLAYAAAGSSLQQWQDPHGGARVSSRACGPGSSSPGSAELFLGLGAINASVAASPAGGCLPAAGQPPPDVLLQVQLLQAHAWLQPHLAVNVPVAEARLGYLPRLGAPVLLPEPLVLLAGLSYSQHCQGQQPPGDSEELLLPRQVQRSTSIQLKTLSLAMSEADYTLALELLRCMWQQPMLPSVPAVQPAAAAQEQQLEQQQVAGASTLGATGVAAAEEVGDEEEEVEEDSELLVQVDAASLTIWPQAQPPAQQQQQQTPQQRAGPREEQQRHGMAVWLSKLQLCTHQLARVGGSTSGSGVRCHAGSSTTDLSLQTAHAALLRRQRAGSAAGSAATPIEFSSVLCFPDAAVRTPHQPAEQQPQPSPALTLALSSSWPGSDRDRDRRSVYGGSTGSLSPSKHTAAAAGRRLQVHAAPLSLAISQDLVQAVGFVTADLDSTKAAALVSEPPQLSSNTAAVSAAEPAGEVEALQGKLAVDGLRLLLLQAACWEEQRVEQGSHQPQAGRHPLPAGASALEVDIEEAIVLLQQVPAAENRPWLAGSQAAAAALLTTVDASLMGAAVTVWHAGGSAACLYDLDAPIA